MEKRKLNMLSENISYNEKKYTVSIVEHGTGAKAVWFSYLSGENGITIEMSGYPIDQRQAKEPHIYSPEEIMDLALNEAIDFAPSLERLNTFEDMMLEFLAEVDENRRIAKILAENAN